MKIVLIIFCLLIFFGCSKIKANHLEGVYDCTYTSYGYKMGEPYDTSYQKDLIIVASNGIIRISGYSGFEVPVKSLDHENCYQQGSSQKWEKICFPKNGVEFSYGHSYHNSSGTTSYVGTRKK